MIYNMHKEHPFVSGPFVNSQHQVKVIKLVQVLNCFSFAEPRGLHPFFPKVCYSCYGHCFTESFCFRFQNCIFTWHSQLSKICWILSGGCELLSELYFYLAFAVLEVQIIENLQL